MIVNTMSALQKRCNNHHFYHCGLADSNQLFTTFKWMILCYLIWMMNRVTGCMPLNFSLLLYCEITCIVCSVQEMSQFWPYLTLVVTLDPDNL